MTHRNSFSQTVELKSHAKNAMRLAALGLSGAALLFVAACSDEKTSEEAGGAPQVETGPAIAAISPQSAKAADIKTSTVGPANIRKVLTLYGSIKPNGEREQAIRARYPGTVRSVEKRPGDAVKRGETLLTIESSESLRVYTISAALDGTVLERAVNPGATVSVDTVLMQIADLTTVWIEVAVFASDLGEVKPGMPMVLTDINGEGLAETAVAYVAPVGHADSQSVVARAVLNNTDRQWIPGQFVTADIVVDETRASKSVVPAAIQNLDGKTVVFLENEGGFQAREVEIGKRSADAVEILKGLEVGDTYVSTNSYLIKADLLKGEGEEE